MKSSDWNSDQKIRLLLKGLLEGTSETLCSEHGVSKEEYLQLLEDIRERATRQLEEAHCGDGGESCAKPANFSDLVNSIPHAVFCKDLEGRFTYGNPTYCEIVKISGKSLFGKDDFDLHTPEAADKFRADDRKVVESGQMFSCQEENVHVDGTSLWTEVVKAPIRNEQGDITGVMGMFWDITSHKSTQQRLLESQEGLEFMVEKRTQELLEANVRLEDSNKFKDMILSSVSHELRTPLTSVLGFSKMIGREAERLSSICSQEQSAWSPHAIRIAENAQIITEEGLRLKRLIDDLLDLGKINSGKMTWGDKIVDVNKVAQDSVRAMQGQFASKPGVKLLCELGEQPVFVNIDPDRLKQIFLNLLNNAAKFTDHGHVKLEMVEREGLWAEGCVSDTGAGISQEDIALIFEDYCQGLSAIASKSGTGLGLSICQQIIMHYGGKFWVESHPGEGAAFFFRLPLLASRSLDSE